MLEIGKTTTLEVVKLMDFGAYLDGGPFGEILLPSNSVPSNTRPGDELSVFIYCDSEDRLIATTVVPLTEVGRYALLEVKDVNKFGAFLEWGLSKDLFVPFREQNEKMVAGRSYIVYTFLDASTDRIVASSRINRFLKSETNKLKVEEPVDLIAAVKTNLGFKVIINNKFWGLLFNSDIHQPVAVGDHLKGFVKTVREDGKVDVQLKKSGYEHHISDDSSSIIIQLKKNNGFLPLTDKSAPELIYTKLKMSKKAFKRALGNLYKQRLVRLEKNGVYLVEQG